MATSKEFFEANPKVDKFHVTEDGGHFQNPNDAKTHAAALKKAGKGKGMITTITRDEAMQAESVEAAETTRVLTPLEQAQTNLSTAQGIAVTTGDALEQAKAALDAANAAKTNLAPDATKQDKTNASKTVTAATRAVANAQAAKDNADLDLQTATEALAALQTNL